MTEPKKIDRDTYLKALAFFTIGNELYVQARDFQLRMDELLGLEDGSRLDDALYNNEKQRVRDFDEALKRQQISVDSEGS